MYVTHPNSKGNQGHQSYQGGGNQNYQGGNHVYQEGKGGNTKKERPICTYCGFIGHIADKCYKLHGYPPGYKPKGKLSGNQVSSNGSFGNCPPTNAYFGNFGNFVS